jgi:general secretion pathway protein E
MRIGTLETDIRVATAPALHGESLVMRLLARGAHALDLARLGMAPDDLARFGAHLEQPHGMIVVTGPTGSGKTTTLTAALAALNRSDRKIMTVEDPIEYQIPGISQTQVRPGIALDFATALRAFLRHDPDILMVGEMRDGETAAVGIQAALTGHLLLTTLHTNSAADVVTRLVDLGVEPFLINATLRCVVGQRLVRQLCPHCRTVDENAGQALKPFSDSGRLTMKADAVIYRAEGCSQCAQTGYRGRIGIFEVLSMDEPLRGMIREGRSAGDIEAAAVSSGMTTMLQDGYAKVSAGQTSVDELLKATI